MSGANQGFPARNMVEGGVQGSMVGAPLGTLPGIGYDPVAAREAELRRLAKARREDIAKHALAGLLAGTSENTSTMPWSPQDAAMHTLLYADALIAELDKG